MTWMARTLAWCTAVVVVSAGRVVAAVQTPQDGFLTLSSADLAKEQLPATPLLFGAYAFVWVALTVYVFLLWRRLNRVERELGDVTTKLANRR